MNQGNGGQKTCWITAHQGDASAETSRGHRDAGGPSPVSSGTWPPGAHPVPPPKSPGNYGGIYVSGPTSLVPDDTPSCLPGLEQSV